MKQIIFDGSNVLWRAHWVATKYSQGYQYQDISVFLSIIHSICNELNCFRVYIAWDDRELRHEINPRRVLSSEYKQNRTQSATCYQHIDLIKQLTMDLGITHVRPYALEGDDVISVLCDELPGHSFVVSADQDLAQLVSDHVSYYSLTKKVLITPDNFSEFFSVPVHQFVTYKCIIGDTSDNISGVPRFGPKRAIKLAEQLHQDPSVVDPDIVSIVHHNRSLIDLKAFIDDQETEFVKSQLAHASCDLEAFRSRCHELSLNKVLQMNFLNFFLS